MKKSYVYFVVPLVALIVFFFGFYWNAHKDFEAREDAKIQKVKDAREAKLLKEAKDREVAVKAAIEMQEKRKREKQERDAREARAKEERENARQAREKAARDADKFEATVKRLEKEIDVEKKEIALIQTDRKRTIDEQNFLKEYVKKAEANARSLTGVLERIEAADKAAEAAAKAAQAAAKAATKK
jgi:colicin import membrane protein